MYKFYFLANSNAVLFSENIQTFSTTLASLAPSNSALIPIGRELAMTFDAV